MGSQMLRDTFNGSSYIVTFGGNEIITSTESWNNTNIKNDSMCDRIRREEGIVLRVEFMKI